MVEAQIQDQVNHIDTKETQNEAYEVLLYGQEVEQKDPATEDLVNTAAQSLINEDKQIEEEEKKRFAARQALSEVVEDTKSKDDDSYLSPSTINAIKNVEIEPVQTEKKKKTKDPLSIKHTESILNEFDEKDLPDLAKNLLSVTQRDMFNQEPAMLAVDEMLEQQTKRDEELRILKVAEEKQKKAVEAATKAAKAKKDAEEKEKAKEKEKAEAEKLKKKTKPKQKKVKSKEQIHVK